MYMLKFLILLLSYLKINNHKKLCLEKIIQIILITLFVNTISYAQSHKYKDDFGNLLSNEQYKELKDKGGIKIKLKKGNIRFGIIPIEYRGSISDSIRLILVRFLESNSNLKIEPTDRIIIDYAINHRCNIFNNIKLKEYIKTVEQMTDLAVFFVIDEYDEKVKSQIVDNSDLVKNIFFNYINWNIKEDYKCGGALVIYPDDTFIRIYGEYNPMDNLKNI